MRRNTLILLMLWVDLWFDLRYRWDISRDRN